MSKSNLKELVQTMVLIPKSFYDSLLNSEDRNVREGASSFNIKQLNNLVFDKPLSNEQIMKKINIKLQDKKDKDQADITTEDKTSGKDKNKEDLNKDLKEREEFVRLNNNDLSNKSTPILRQKLKEFFDQRKKEEEIGKMKEKEAISNLVSSEESMSSPLQSQTETGETLSETSVNIANDKESKELGESNNVKQFKEAGVQAIQPVNSADRQIQTESVDKVDASTQSKDDSVTNTAIQTEKSNVGKEISVQTDDQIDDKSADDRPVVADFMPQGKRDLKDVNWQNLTPSLQNLNSKQLKSVFKNNQSKQRESLDKGSVQMNVDPSSVSLPKEENVSKVIEPSEVPLPKEATASKVVEPSKVPLPKEATVSKVVELSDKDKVTDPSTVPLPSPLHEEDDQQFKRQEILKKLRPRKVEQVTKWQKYNSRDMQSKKRKADEELENNKSAKSAKKVIGKSKNIKSGKKAVAKTIKSKNDEKKVEIKKRKRDANDTIASDSKKIKVETRKRKRQQDEEEEMQDNKRKKKSI